MSSDKVKTLEIKILDRDLRVACPEDERAELLDAVSYLDQKMREIRDAGKIVSVERIAIMAALNIAHEFLELRERGGFSLDTSQKLKFLQTKIDAALRWDAQTRQ